MSTLPIVTRKSKLCRFTQAVLIMLALLPAINALQTQARTSGPKIVVSEYRHDFGEVFAGQFMDHVFTIRNEGTSPLTLSDVVPHPPNASVYRQAPHRVLASGLIQGLSGLFSLKAATTGTAGFIAANAGKAGSSGPALPVPT